MKNPSKRLINQAQKLGYIYKRGRFVKIQQQNLISIDIDGIAWISITSLKKGVHSQDDLDQLQIAYNNARHDSDILVKCVK